MNNHKYVQLDSLRGLAAVIVCFLHYFLIDYSINSGVRMVVPWHFFLAGSESVLLFFVLSGFVLSIMLDNQQAGTFKYSGFVVRRVFRLYPAYHCALIISLILFIYIKPYQMNNLSDWFNTYNRTSIDFISILKYFSMVSSFPNRLDNVAWSLIYEMLISLVFPLVFIIIMRFSKLSWLKVVWYLGVILVYFLLTKFILGVALMDNLYYTHFFVIGVLLYKFKTSLHRVAGLIFLLLGLTLYFFRFISFDVFSSYSLFVSHIIYNEITLLGTVLILINSLYYQPLIRVLSFSLLRFYGNISYSFYLIHLPVMYGCVYFLYGRFVSVMFFIKIISFIVATVVSYIMYVTVEKRFIKFGKYLTK